MTDECNRLELQDEAVARLLERIRSQSFLTRAVCLMNFDWAVNLEHKCFCRWLLTIIQMVSWRIRSGDFFNLILV